MFANEMPDRRDFMRTVAMLLCASMVPGLSACTSAMQGVGALNEAQMAQLIAIADTIIPDGVPAAEKPGAVAAAVPKLLSGMLRDWASEKTRSEVIGAIDAIGKLGRDAGFAALSRDKRTETLIKFDAAAVASGTPTHSPGYITLKGLIINLHYTSEVVMTRYMIYEHSPGKFIPSIVAEPGKSPEKAGA